MMSFKKYSISDLKSFWDALRNLGPQNKFHIPMEMYMNDQGGAARGVM